MSRQNKVNPGQYTSAGRLSPDDLGRERRVQAAARTSTRASKIHRPAWEKAPAPAKGTAPASSSNAGGRVTVAAARAVVGVTRATAGAVKSMSRAARTAIGAPASARQTAKKAAKKSSATTRAKR